MTDLDELALDRVDPAGMLATVESSAAMWREAHALAQDITLEPSFEDVSAVLVCGMGGSGIAGDVAALAADRAGRVPVIPVKGYELPGWASPRHLVIAVSYSGGTEETLTLVEAASTQGCPIAAVTSGGDLADRARQGAWPLIEIPGGNQPRASLPYLAAPVLGLLVAAGLVDTRTLDDVAAAADAVDEAVARWGRSVPTGGNDAKRLARELRGRVPVIYGGRGVAAVVALRAKCQINENAARPAFYNEIPERDHNELVGWQADPGDLVAVELRSIPDEHPQVARRFSAGTAEFPSPPIEHALTGETWLERFMTGVAFVDLVSVYLAFLHGVDPTPVEPIERLKRRIAAEVASA